MSSVAYLYQEDVVQVQVSTGSEITCFLNQVDPITLDILPTSPQLSLVLGNAIVVVPSGPATYVYLNLIASQTISIHTVMAPDGTGGVVYASNNAPTAIGRAIGLAWNSANTGDTVQVIVSGEVDEPSWNWTPGEVYLGVNGTLTQTAPSTGFVQVIGVALTATRLSVGIQLPILLS